MYDLGRRLWNREAGLHAAWLLLFTVQFTLQARRGQLDALLMFCTVLSLYCLLRQLLLGGGWWWAVGAGAGRRPRHAREGGGVPLLPGAAALAVRGVAWLARREMAATLRDVVRERSRPGRGGWRLAAADLAAGAA